MKMILSKIAFIKTVVLGIAFAILFQVVLFSFPTTADAALGPIVWTEHAGNPDTNTWKAVTWSPELGIFVAITCGINSAASCNSTAGNRVMTSTDGITWTSRVDAEDSGWLGITWSSELGIFVVVGQSGTNRVMTSPDGINWTPHTAAEQNSWRSVTWSPELGLFVAVACGVSSGSCDSTATNRVMTSTNGTDWIARADTGELLWNSVIWSPELGMFAAVATNGGNVMTSPDGITWTSRTAPAANAWRTITWSPELGMFAAVASSGTNRVMTSTNGITWTGRTAAEASSWFGITWSSELDLFVAVASSGTNQIMTSPNGIDWTAQAEPVSNTWSSVTWSPELRRFVATSEGGTNRVMVGKITPAATINVVDNLTNEGGDTGRFCVQLSYPPTADVTIALNSSDTAEVTTPSSITISAANWNAATNCVTVTGVDESVGDGAQVVTITTGDVTSSDTEFNALDGSTISDVSITNENDDPPGIAVDSIIDTTSGEDGSTATVNFRLLSQPIGGANVTIPLSLSDATEGDLGGVTDITITNANWNNPSANQVTITGLDDVLSDGNITYDLVTGDPTSSDTTYNDLVAADVVDITLTNIDDETPNVITSETGGSTDVTEGGTTDTIEVSITTQPSTGKEVVITISPEAQINLGAGAGIDVDLTFDENNWNTPQTLTITAVDDASVEGDHTAIISYFVDSSTTEPSYLSVTSPNDTTVSITDNDTAEEQTANPEVTGVNSSSNSSPSAPSCGDTKPRGTPNLFQIDVNNTQATLYFAPVPNASSYFISYGEDQNTERHGVQFNSGVSNGVLSYTINQLLPNTTYSFKVRSGNGCMPGDWGNTMQVKTRNTSQGGTSFYKNFVSRILSALPRQVTNAGSGSAANVPTTKASSGGSCEYIVESGDSLWNISAEQLGSGKKYTEIMQKNNLKSTSLKTGQKLQVGC